LTASGGKNKVLEFTWPGTLDLSIPERATIANMIADKGGTAGVFPPDEVTHEWLERQNRSGDFVELSPDDGAEYDDRIEIDLGELGPLVAKP
jgi:aconitase A